MHSFILRVLSTRLLLPACQKLFFFFLSFRFWSLIPEAHPRHSGPAPQSAVLFLWWWRDGWLKEIDPDGADISQADKWQPQTWKAISRDRGVKPGQAPADFHDSSVQSAGPCQATTWQWVLAPPRVAASLRCYQPACWHGAEPQSLMNKPCKETWRGRPVFPFKCYDSCNWQRALWELKISALTGYVFNAQCLQFVNTDVMIQTGIWTKQRVVKSFWNEAPNMHMCWVKVTVKWLWCFFLER